MKTSDKLMVGLLLVGLLTLVGSTVALKAEHDKIDFNDPFYGYSATTIKPFRVLKIEVDSANKQPVKSTQTAISIQVGKSFAIRRQDQSSVPFTYRSVGDTLLVRYKPERIYWHNSTDDLLATKPFAYIIVPSIGGLVANGAICTLTGLNTDSLQITSTNALVRIDKSIIGQLTASGQRGSFLQTASANRIKAATITTCDSTGFTAERDVFGSLSMQNDANTMISLPASLLRKLQ
ncbi:hypothetical protein [Spirosoma oryzicola]|uniref:hypothetical protein n=1 Tax=Spirosoma oryzicola TaxID=2898794 RepID=UPI001E3ABCB4|nr:hypothetical protein [Spirosoma oryzicola]UHG90521.1 hypothetical protein LQ777_20005 [Spirosoma oryzicola]